MANVLHHANHVAKVSQCMCTLNSIATSLYIIHAHLYHMEPEKYKLLNSRWTSKDSVNNSLPDCLSNHVSAITSQRYFFWNINEKRTTNVSLHSIDLQSQCISRVQKIQYHKLLYLVVQLLMCSESFKNGWILTSTL